MYIYVYDITCMYLYDIGISHVCIICTYVFKLMEF